MSRTIGCYVINISTLSIFQPPVLKIALLEKESSSEPLPFQIKTDM
jgi:hypothetical protein